MRSLDFDLRSSAGGFELEASGSVRGGTCLAVVGPSGSGKTTLLRSLAGLHLPDEGHVAVGGETWLDTRRGVDLWPEERRCGYVFQDYALFPNMSVLANVGFGVEGPGRRRAELARASLERLRIPELANRRVFSLSGGERQRVALARALASEPQILLLDEPFAALDAGSRASAMAELSRVLDDVALPTVMVTHDLTEAARFATEIVVLVDGSVAQRGSVNEITAAPSSPFVARMAGAAMMRGLAEVEGPAKSVVRLDGGGAVVIPREIEGEVVIGLFPWDLTLEVPQPHRRFDATATSASNHLECTVESVYEVAGRVRVGLAAPQGLVAEVTPESQRRLALEPGQQIRAVFKATAVKVFAP